MNRVLVMLACFSSLTGFAGERGEDMIAFGWAVCRYQHMLTESTNVVESWQVHEGEVNALSASGLDRELTKLLDARNPSDRIYADIEVSLTDEQRHYAPDLQDFEAEFSRRDDAKAAKLNALQLALIDYYEMPDSGTAKEDFKSARANAKSHLDELSIWVKKERLRVCLTVIPNKEDRCQSIFSLAEAILPYRAAIDTRQNIISNWTIYSFRGAGYLGSELYDHEVNLMKEANDLIAAEKDALLQKLLEVSDDPRYRRTVGILINDIKSLDDQLSVSAGIAMSALRKHLLDPSAAHSDWLRSAVKNSETIDQISLMKLRVNYEVLAETLVSE